MTAPAPRWVRDGSGPALGRRLLPRWARISPARRLPGPHARPRIVVDPRWLAVARDYPRHVDGAGRPVLDASRVVALPAGFPAARARSSGAAWPWPEWTARTAQHRARHRTSPAGGGS